MRYGPCRSARWFTRCSAPQNTRRAEATRRRDERRDHRRGACKLDGDTSLWPPQHGRERLADIGLGHSRPARAPAARGAVASRLPRGRASPWAEARCMSPPLQRPWWPRAHGRRCPALPRRHAAISHSSITATRCGSLTFVCVPSLMRTLVVYRPRGRRDPRRYVASARRRPARSRVLGRPAHDTQDRPALRARTL
jgi:hypothetical protein